ncbi:MAG TPA: hypothetical protein DCO77_07905 [Nitrospiraceae bacterium]|nr:hypothetical protein [Nitrospiraceae bacterium]
MKSMKRNIFLTALLMGVVAVTIPQGAGASTPPCTQISNQATLSYSVGAVAQTPITSTLGAGNQFYVGVKVIVTVANTDAGNVAVTAGTTPVVLSFSITNDGNAVHDYALAVEAAANGVASPHGGGNDSFDGTTVNVFVESGATAGYQALEDTATLIDGLAVDGGATTAYIVYTPSDLTAADGSLAVYYLTATTQWADGSAIGAQGSQTPSLAQAGGVCDGAKAVDVVFGDGDGPSTADTAARDAIHSDDSAYIVTSAAISVTKSYSVVSDSINTSAPYSAIPGAVIRYSIAIANTGGASAVLSTTIDALNGNLQVVSTAANATWSVAGSTRGTTSGTLTADTNNADGLAHSAPGSPGGTLTATLTTVLAADAGNGYAAGELKTGETVTLTFDATIE